MLLSGAWDKYAKALQTGEVLELESDYETWVARALNASSVGVSVEAD
jgi:hypothetical protein